MIYDITQNLKFIVAQSKKTTEFRYIENYLHNNRIDSIPYLIPGNYDKIYRQQFFNWIKKPTKELWDKNFLEVIV
ncbi:unnamed protein product [Blepharisma stoltei]|uniref:Uncharacterized protein n=1 Tax=Blepharisma stoltei TaxID=1481888 RepID=A0AAU9JZ07_9CILI|nr:unnamed protein product [Blepharisma stoltei]